MKTQIKLSRQAIVDKNIDWQAKRIVNLEDPVDDQDAVTKIYVDTTLASGAGTVGIGAAEDGAYVDGLFTDFIPATPVGTAVDRFNEVLKSLSPQPAPSLSSASCSNTGVSGKLSFGVSNAISGYTNVPGVDINGAFSASGTRLGIFNASTAIGGTLANNVAPSYVNGRPYPNAAFGDANQGNLLLEVNGAVVRTVDLVTFGSGNSLNANGSGFNLSAATSVAFTNGDVFDVFKYRTGTWTVSAASQVNGYNTARVRHEYAPGVYRDCQTYSWVVDADTTATAFSNETLDNLSMTGLRYLSGVKYHTGGTVEYNISVANAFRNTYSASGSAINHSGSNASIADAALPSMAAQSDPVQVTSKVATLTPTRLLNGAVSVNTQIDRTVQADATSPGVSVSGVFVDSTTDDSTTTVLRFNGEGRRINDGLDITSTAYGSAAGSQPYDWDSMQSLVGGDATHNKGLLEYNGLLSYPKTNFATLASNGPSSNVDYSAAAGNRTYIGFFHDSLAHSNFRFNVTATGTAFVPLTSGPSGNNLTFEVLAPNTTSQGSTVEWKDAVVPKGSSDNDKGCYASTYGNVIPTNWGCTLGTKNTSTSGNVIVIRVTASAAWTGSISSIGITWL
jgi:hypothetical protein